MLDSWHWYNAGETADDLLTLTNQDIVACDLNDAPAGLSPRPAARLSAATCPRPPASSTSKPSCNALVAIGYDGPVRAEPFDAELRKLPAEQAVARTAQAMKAGFRLNWLVSGARHLL